MKKPLKILLIMVTVLAFIVIIPPVVSFGVLTATCNSKMDRLDKQAALYTEKLRSMNLKADDLKVRPSGDCLTGSGTSFNFTVRKEYANTYAAIADINSNLKNAKIDTLESTVEQPRYTFAGEDGASGGSTPIAQLELTYTVNKLESGRS